nr:MAG TPA: hypothetical protein [Caudoviricetes sp.]
MAINEESRRKEFKDCTSFEELARVCNRYSYVFENFADEVRNKIYELPAEFNEDFIKFLLKSYRLDNDLTEDNLRTTYASFLRDYANKIVNAGILKNPGIKSEYIPVIVFSATNHDQIDMTYLLETCSINPKSIEEIFYNKNYSNIMSTKLESNQDIKYSRDEMRIIDILTSNAAYEDFLYQFSTELDKKEGTEYLYLRAQRIFNQYIAPHAIIDTKEIEVMDIYNFLIYLITTIEQNQDYLNSTSQRILFEQAIRNIYDSIDMIILHIKIIIKKNIRFPLDKGIIFAEGVKVDVIKAIIEEAFLYMYRYQNQLNKREDIRKYFDIRYDENRNTTCYRVIPDSPLVFLDKDPSPVATEAYDKNSSKMDQASRKIYSGYKAYKDAENKVDSQITKLITRIKGVFTGEKTARDRIIEGEQFSAIKILKKIFTTAAIFSYSKIAGVLFVITRHYCSKAVDNKERKRLISELELEIKMLDEKIDDARGDGNRQAKYSMMRTRAELQKALEQIKYGLTADKKALNTARAVASGKKNLDYYGPSRNDRDED